MKHPRRLGDMLALALVGILMFGCGEKRTTHTTPPPPQLGHQIIVYVTPDTPEGTCKVSMDPVRLSQNNKDYVTWELLGHATGNKHTVKFDTPDGTPCDSSESSFDMAQGAAQSKNCTVQNAAAGKTYKYSIYKGNSTKLCDPSVGIDP